MAPLFHLRGYLRRHIGALVLGVVFVVCGSGVALLGPLVLQRAIDSLGRPHPGHPLWLYALLIVAVALASAVFSFGTRWTINSASRRIEYELRNDLCQTLLAGVFLPVMTAVFVALGRRIERSFRRVQDQFGDLSAMAQENFSGIRVVKAYVQEEHEIVAFGRTNWDYVSHSMHYARLSRALWPA